MAHRDGAGPDLAELQNVAPHGHISHPESCSNDRRLHCPQRKRRNWTIVRACFTAVSLNNTDQLPMSRALHAAPFLWPAMLKTARSLVYAVTVLAFGFPILLRIYLNRRFQPQKNQTPNSNPSAPNPGPIKANARANGRALRKHVKKGRMAVRPLREGGTAAAISCRATFTTPSNAKRT